jgi:hypothetical protein
VPGVTETSTRLPVESPFFPNADDPTLAKVIVGVALLSFALIALQWRRGAATPK